MAFMPLSSGGGPVRYKLSTMNAAATSFPAGIRLETKLNAPLGARRPVARDTLLDRLVDREPRRLTLVDAPAGWGKTTLLAEWAADPRERRRFAWFTIDRGDNDPVRFWAYAIESLRAVASVGRSSLAALGVSGTDPVDVVLPPLINELTALDGRVVLVLEDYHLIHSDAVHDGVAFLLDHAPPAFELAIATRLDPPLPLARLRARGEMLELRTAELRFDETEAHALLRAALGDTLSGTDVERLVARTEGWPAGLYLAALSLGGRADQSEFIEAFAGDDRHIVDYLGGEVLDGIDPATRTFLLRTSILERVCGPLCDHVLETSRRSTPPARDRAGKPLPRRPRRAARVVPLPPPLRRPPPLRARARRAGARAGAPPARSGVARSRTARSTRRSGTCSRPATTNRARGVVASGWRAPFNRGELATVDRWLDDLPEPAVLGEPDLSPRARMGAPRPRQATRRRTLAAGASSAARREKLPCCAR